MKSVLQERATPAQHSPPSSRRSVPPRAGGSRVLARSVFEHWNTRLAGPRLPSCPNNVAQGRTPGREGARPELFEARPTDRPTLPLFERTACLTAPATRPAVAGRCLALMPIILTHRITFCGPPVPWIPGPHGNACVRACMHACMHVQGARAAECLPAALMSTSVGLAAGVEYSHVS